MKMLCFLLLVSSILASKEIVMVPNFHATDELFHYDRNAAFQSLTSWEKIHCLLAENGVNLRIGNLNWMTKSPKKILRACELLKQEETLYFIIDYHKHIFKYLLTDLPSKNIALLILEPPTVHEELHTNNTYAKFSKVITWDDSRIDNKRVFKYHYPVLVTMEENLVPFSERRFCCQFGANKKSSFRNELYSERKKAIEFFNQFPELFDFYGPGWKKEKYVSYKGDVSNKNAHLRNHKFSICYENTTNIRGYITEKIFDCFAVGVVPIYYGATNISSYIPENCFIDRRKFASYQRLLSFLESITEETFNQFLINIREYLSSQRARVFSNNNFVCSIVNALIDTNYTPEELDRL